MALLPLLLDGHALVIAVGIPRVAGAALAAEIGPAVPAEQFGGQQIPIGYMIDSEQYFQLDPLTAPFVLEAFKQYAEGATMKEIRDYLNEHGMNSPQR